MLIKTFSLFFPGYGVVCHMTKKSFFQSRSSENSWKVHSPRSPHIDKYWWKEKDRYAAFVFLSSLSTRKIDFFDTIRTIYVWDKRLWRRICKKSKLTFGTAICISKELRSFHLHTSLILVVVLSVNLVSTGASERILDWVGDEFFSFAQIFCPPKGDFPQILGRQLPTLPTRVRRPCCYSKYIVSMQVTAKNIFIFIGIWFYLMQPLKW